MNNIKYIPFKRLFDITFSIFSILIFFIPVLLTALFIKLTSDGPVFFQSVRYGKNNKLFSMIKLRTMFINTPELSYEHLFYPGKYITAIGKILRKTGIDELPQLINILKGEMSFVGPRPLICDDEELLELRNRFGVNKLKPGLTGLAQINGRNKLTAKEKFKFDNLYYKNISFKEDILILLKTNSYLFFESFSSIKYLKIQNFRIKINYLLYLPRNILKNSSIILIYLFFISNTGNKFKDYTFFMICKSYEFCLNL